MRNLLDQLYQSKLQLIAVVSAIVGIILLGLGHWVASLPTSNWLASLPLSELGSTIFSTGLLAIFFEYVDRKHGDKRAEQRVRAAVRQEAPAIRDAVLDSFAFDINKLKGVASPDTLDRITAGALGLRLGDQRLAEDVYTDIRNQVIRAPERWLGVGISVSLSPWADGPVAGRASMFVVTLRCEYRTVPATPTMRFACVSDLDEYRDLLDDPTTTSVWHFESVAGLDASSSEAFELVHFAVNGQPRPIRRTERKGSQLYTANLGETLATSGQEVTIAFTYRALVRRHGHLLYLDLPRLTKGLKIQFTYGDCGIRRVNTLDFIASAQRARVERTPTSVPAKLIDIGFDGWIFPRSGVAFVWVLEEEPQAAS